MAKKFFGLKSIKVAPIAGDGGMGTALTTIGETVLGTAGVTQEDNTVTDFGIEESDSPVESVVSATGKLSLAWSSYQIDYYTLTKLFGGTGNPKISVGSINTLGSITGGSLYTNGFYENVPLTGGAGTGAYADITVAGGAVTSVVLRQLGSGYAVSNNLSAAAANIGGTGSGFTVPVSAVHATAANEKWEAPDSFADTELSVQATDNKGNIVNFPRMKLSSKPSLSFRKDGLGQIDITGTVLQPTKVGEKRMTIIFAN